MNEVWYRFELEVRNGHKEEAWRHYPKTTKRSDVKDDCEYWATHRYPNAERIRYGYERKTPPDEWVVHEIVTMRKHIRDIHRELEFLRETCGDSHKDTRPRYALEPEDIRKVNETLLGAIFAEFDIHEDGSWEAKLRKNGVEYVIIPHSIIGPTGVIV